MIITNVRKKSVAKQGFKFTRLKGAGEYSIVHLFDPAAVLIGDAYVGTKETPFSSIRRPPNNRFPAKATPLNLKR